MTDSTALPASPHPRQPVLRLWLAVGGMAAALVLALALGLPEIAPGLQRPPFVGLAALSLLAGYGLSLPLVVGWVGRRHARALLRFRWAKAIASVLLAVFFPVAIWGQLPSALGFWLFFYVGAGIARADIAMLLGTLGIGLGASALSYAIASALIWGLRRRYRIGGFLLFYAGQVALVAALGLVYSGHL